MTDGPRKAWWFSAVVFAACLCYWSVDTTEPARLGLALLTLIAGMWVLEILHVTVTALLIPVLATLLGLLTLRESLSQFSHPIIFLFLGGFALASALHRQQVDEMLAHKILKISRGRVDAAVLLLAGTAAFLSMWISNTASTAIMMPLVIGLLKHQDTNSRSAVFALLVIAYSASIGGIATLVGSPPNAIVAAHLGLSFSDWMHIGLPISLLLWPLMLIVTYLTFRPRLHNKVTLNDQFEFRWTPARIRLAAIFLTTVAGWLFSKPLAGLLGIDSGIDSWIALSALIALVANRVVEWKNLAKDTDWGVLLLFGGGLTLSKVLAVSGASAVLGEKLGGLISSWPSILILLAIIAFVVFLTELSSNTATTALLVPIFTALPLVDLTGYQTAMAIGISASCAFMLPVATPPNAIVHGTGRVPIRQMMRVGLRLNCMCIMAVTLLLYFLL